MNRARGFPAAFTVPGRIDILCSEREGVNERKLAAAEGFLRYNARGQAYATTVRVINRFINR